MINSPSKIDLKIATQAKPELTWSTILFDCNCHTFEAVIEQLMKAINCTYATASQLAHVADQLGSVAVYKGNKERCEKIADVLGSIGLDVKVAL
jgi:hypothetical protein